MDDPLQDFLDLLEAHTEAKKEFKQCQLGGAGYSCIQEATNVDYFKSELKQAFSELVKEAVMEEV
jgi:hypothetical protein